MLEVESALEELSYLGRWGVGKKVDEYPDCADAKSAIRH